VAVKIQRPDMLLSITLDLYIVRAMLVLGQAFPVIAEECKGDVRAVAPHACHMCSRRST
jgi:predicted unusual protein kinase regulating ubiquinone biosynthesis (AarF/ABC1/UbiB family)